MNTGKLWGSTPTIYQAYEGAMWRPADNDQPCALSSVLALDMTKHTTGEFSITFSQLLSHLLTIECFFADYLLFSINKIIIAIFDFFYLAQTPSGYTLDIADAGTSNGDGNDAGVTPFHTEFQVRNENIELFMNSNEGYTQLEIDDNTPLLLENLTFIVERYTKLSVGWFLELFLIIVVADY